jgi:hypothetical protein
MTISIVQPDSNRATRTSHTPFQLVLSTSSTIVWSRTAPSAFVWKKNPLRRSWNVSKTTVRFSFWTMLLLSRRSSERTNRSG